MCPAQSVERLATPPAAQVQQEAVSLIDALDPSNLCHATGTPEWPLNCECPKHATHPAADALGAVRETGAVESLRGLAAVIRTYGTCAPSALDVVADRIEAALAQAPAVRVTDVLLRVSDEDLRWCKDAAIGMEEAGGPTNNMRAVGLRRLISALEAALGQGKAS